MVGVSKAINLSILLLSPLIVDLLHVSKTDIILYYSQTMILELFPSKQRAINFKNYEAKKNIHLSLDANPLS